jgi:thiol-disulfide isomerase/thioredoxin
MMRSVLFRATIATFSFAFAVVCVLADDITEPRPQPVELAVEDPATEPAGPLTWHKELEPALREARERNAPVLVRVGATWCGWCRRLDREIVKPEVQQALGRWVLVELDADEDQDEVRRMNVGPIPALRSLDAGGHVLRSHDGYLAAKPLVDWLRRAGESGRAGEALGADVPELSAATLPKLVKLLGHRDPELRDAAVRQLKSDRALTATAVTAAFRQGTLATRLSALDVLTHWKAPVTALDPWDPATLTPERLEGLDQWVGKEIAN